jgi:hypothetical protein
MGKKAVTTRCEKHLLPELHVKKPVLLFHVKVLAYTTY